MGLSTITIRNQAGGLLATATGSLRINQKSSDATDTTTVSGSCEDDVATIWYPYFTSVFDEAYKSFFDGTNTYLQTINGVRPTEDGAFFIEGSDCVSWSFTQPRLDSDSVSEGSAVGNTIAITDLCPSCDVCDKVLEIKKAVEYYKIIYNGLKDVLLYEQSVAATRASALIDKRLSVPEKCSDGVDTKYLSNVEPKMLNKVLAGYMRTVRMWNWAVSQNSRSVEISTTPESDTGFYVQTKYALPNCGNCSALKLIIEVRLTSGQSNLSVYVPQTAAGKKYMLVTKPFDGGVDPDAVMENIVEEPTHKKITLDFGPPSKAVTHIVRVKFLPFSQNILKLANGRTLTMAMLALQAGDTKMTAAEEGTETSFVTGSTKYYMKPANTIQTLNAPTAAEYEAYSVYPSKTSKDPENPSDVGYNIWEIGVTWIWGQPDTSSNMEYVVSDADRVTTTMTQEAVTMTKTFTFQTTRVREFMEGIILDSDLQDIAKT